MSATTHRTSAETRAHLLRVAGDLFYEKGIRATGVDLVAARAGVAPTTLYRLFGSKDDLVAAYVEQADQGFRDMVTAAIDGAGPDPRDQILAVFDAVFTEVAGQRFRGCPMLMAMTEFPDADLAAHRRAVESKGWSRARLGDLTERLGVADPATVADHLTLAMEGLHASGQALGAQGPARQARQLAEAILSAARR